MQPRRDRGQEPYGYDGHQASDGFDQEDAYQPVKPVGYEARLAFEREARNRQGRPEPSARPGNGVPPYGARTYRPAQRGDARMPVQGQAPYTGGQPPVGAPPTGGYRPVHAGGEQPYVSAQGVPFQQTGGQPVMPPPDFQDTQAEELLRERSPELMEKRGDFWKPVGESAKDKPKDKPKEKPQAKPASKVKLVPKPRKNHVLRGLLLFLAVAFGVGVLVRSVLFSVRAAQVSGNVNMSEAEVLDVAGIAVGQNMFELDEEEVSRRINANRYLSFERLRLDWPDGVTLFVNERVPCAYTKAYGMLYVLAEDGMVLEESSDIDHPPELLSAQGFQEGKVMVGRTIASSSSEKLKVFVQLISELQLQEYMDQISELNISNVDNIFLVTVDRYTVQLGDASDLRAKVGAMRAVVDKLREMGNESGTINVADDPVHPTYMP